MRSIASLSARPSANESVPLLLARAREIERSMSDLAAAHAALLAEVSARQNHALPLSLWGQVSINDQRQ